MNHSSKNLENIIEYTHTQKQICLNFVFCSHFLTLRTLGLIFYTLIDIGICPLSPLNEQGLKRFFKKTLSSPVLAPDNLESNSQFFFSFTCRDKKYFFKTFQTLFKVFDARQQYLLPCKKIALENLNGKKWEQKLN